jgi:nicotinamidase-related amidase
MPSHLSIPLRKIVRPARMGVHENDFQARTLEVPLPLNQCALILLDVWDSHHISSHQARCDRITRTVLNPLIASARNAGLRIIHAPGSDIARRIRPRTGDTPRNFWVGEIRSEEWPSSQENLISSRFESAPTPEVIALRHNRSIHPAATPEPHEAVVATGEELHAYLAQHGAHFLFFAGFAANICVLYRDYGMRAMRGRGFEVILLRDATTGLETAATLPMESALQAALHEVELNLGYTAAAADLIRALQA